MKTIKLKYFHIYNVLPHTHTHTHTHVLLRNKD